MEQQYHSFESAIQAVRSWRNKMSFFDENHFPESLSFKSPNNLIIHEHKEMDDIAKKQLLAKMDIPSGYMGRCPDSLEEKNINYWLQNPPTDNKLMLRQYVSSDIIGVRAVLSEMYSKIPNIAVLESIYQALKGIGMYDVKSIWFDGNDIIGRVVMPVHESGFDDKMSSAIHFENSEIGNRSLKVGPMVWREVCSNGMMGWGVDEDNIQRHIYYDADNLVSDITDWVRSSVNSSKDGLDMMQNARRISVDKPIKKIIEIISQRNALPERLEERAIKSFHSDRFSDKNMFSVVNAITNAAQWESIDKRLEIERDAGRLLASVS